MLNTRYRLVAPYTIEPIKVCEGSLNDKVAVRPTFMSICNADQRYYQSKRSAAVMREKLPMALIHESIGEIVLDPTKNFKSGQRVVMLPNQLIERDEFRGENYLKSSQFCGSGHDGFMQELCFLPAYRVIALPDTVNNEIGAFTELVSVASHAISRFDAIAHNDRQTIGVWGDGNLGYIVSLLLRIKFPNSTIAVYGKSYSKLANFSFVDKMVINYEDTDLVEVDHAFECCGGEGSAPAISQIINSIKPEGAVSLLGVSESPIPVLTRMVLEKGLRLFGSTRSARSDFEDVVDLLKTDDRLPSYLSVLVNEVIDARSVSDIAYAFSQDSNKQGGKTIIKWEM